LLERDAGPILEDFPHDVDQDNDHTPAACPVSFTTAPPPQGEVDLLLSRFRDEILAMRSWYDLAKKKSGRTTSGVSGLDADDIAILFADFMKKGGTVPVVEGQALGDALTRASQDLIDYYLEAASAQPGQTTSPGVLADWFWGETCAAQVIDLVRKNCLQTGDKALCLVGKLLLIPRNQMHRFESSATGR
jgi:hypothetical protein